MVVGKLFHVQIIKHELLKERAEANWDREIPFGGMRGDILDRNGNLLVGSKLAPTLYFMPSQNKEIPSSRKSFGRYTWNRTLLSWKRKCPKKNIWLN